MPAKLCSLHGARALDAPSSVFPVPVGVERCKGSYEEAKCLEEERRLAAETPEQKRERQSTVGAERKANMDAIHK